MHIYKHIDIHVYLYIYIFKYIDIHTSDALKAFILHTLALGSVPAGII